MYCNHTIGHSVVCIIPYIFLSFIDATVEARLLNSGLLVAFTAAVAVNVTIYSSMTYPLFNRSSSSLVLVSLLRATE